MSKLTAGTYEKYNAKYSTLTLTDGEYALTVTPEKGGMATSFTKSGEEYLWLRDKNYESSDRPRCGVPILFPSCGKPDGVCTTLTAPIIPLRSTALPICCPGRSRPLRMMRSC